MPSSGAHRRPGRTALVLLQIIVFATYLFGPTATLAEDPTPEPSPTEPAASEPAPAATPEALEATPEPAEPPAAAATPEPSAPAAADPLPYLVTFAPGTSQARQLEVLASAGAIDVEAIPQLALRSILLDATAFADQLATLRAVPDVLRVEADRIRAVGAAPTDSSYADQWSLPHIGWEELHGSAVIAGSATVAILDTGVDASHPDLDGVVLPGWSALAGVDPLTDPNGHGTWMAGIVAAETDNAFGVAGTAYAGVSVLPITVLGADGTGQDSDIIAGVVHAADAGADVILMAFSNPGYSTALQAAIDYAWESGTVLVAATGNDGVSTATFPAGDRGVIGVTATDASDALAGSANHGPAAFLAAPGVDIWTTASFDPATAQPGDEVVSISGTSAAAAAVAGAAALLVANEPELSNGVVVSRLARTADAAGDPADTGNGRINLARAMADASLDAIQPEGAAPVGDGGPMVGPYVAAAPAPQFDIAPSHAPATGSRVFTAIVRNVVSSSSDTARCIRVTTPASVTVSAGAFTVASPGTTGPWTLTSGANFVQLRSSGAGIFGTATSSNNWVRFEITANATAAATSSWTARMTSTNADCASGGSSDQLGVSVAQVLPRQYTADFRDAGNALIAAPTVVEDTAQAYRIRITRTGGGDDLQHILVALPTCFTGISAISTTDSGPPAYTAELTDNAFRLIPNTKLAANGQWVQVHFTATADCPTGAHQFRTASWKNTSPETAQGDIFQLAAGTLHPTLTVLSANVAPIANNDAYSTDEDTTLNVGAPGILGNDVDTNPVTVASPRPLSAPVNGSLMLNADGSFQYVPNANFFGTDTFTYRATDGSLDSNVATVTITVNAANDPPVAVDDAYSLSEDGTLAESATDGVLSNDTDLEDDTLSAILVDDVDHGLLSLESDGSFTYAPGGDYCGTDSFTYRANDGAADSDVASVTLTIWCVNDEPTADAGSTSVFRNSQDNPFTLAGSDVETSSANLTFTVTGGPDDGTVEGTPPNLTYTPDPGFVGTDEITFTVTDRGDPDNCAGFPPACDGALTSTEATFTITVVNRVPTLAVIADQTDDEGDGVSLATVGADDDGDELSFSATGLPADLAIDADTGLISGTIGFDAAQTNGGVYSVAVTVSDGLDTADQTFTWTVNNTNRAPVLGAVDDEEIPEMVAFGFDADAPDPDGDTVTFSLLDAPDGASIDPDSGVFSWTPSEAQGPGTYAFTVVATDDGLPNLSDTQVVELTVTEVNRAPAIDPIDDVAIPEMASYTFTATATDPDLPANELTFSLVGAPSGASINPTTGFFSWTPTEAQGPGMYALAVCVTDDGIPAMAACDGLTITVDEVNRAPELDPIGDRAVDEQADLTFAAAATDPDLPANALTFILVGAPDGAAIDPLTGVFTWTPTEAQGPDDYPFDVCVTDDGDPVLVDCETITVTVAEVNRAPELDPIGDQTVDEQSELTFTAAATDPDIPANGLTFSLDGAPDGASIDPQTGVFTWTPTEAQGPDDYTFDVCVTDDGTPPLDHCETITVTVNEVNLAPVLGAVGNQTVDEETELTFTATATDADIPANALTFSLVGAPAGASIDPLTGVFTWTPTEAQGPGSYELTVRVTDDGTPSLFDDETITVTVSEVNLAPVLAAVGDQAVDEESELTFTASATDADIPANELTFSLLDGTADCGEVDSCVVPGGAGIDPVTGVFSWTPSEEQGPGTYRFIVRVADDGTPSLFDQETITVTVAEVNRAPALDAIADASIPEEVAYTFTATATDPDLPANTLTFSLVGAPAGAGISDDGIFSWTPDEAQGPQTYQFTVIVTDNGDPALADSQFIEISVLEVNQAPVLAPIADAMDVPEGSELTFDAESTDADLPANALTYSLVGAPAGATIHPVTGIFSWTPDDNLPAPATFDVCVTDDGAPALDDCETLAVTVSNVAPTATFAAPESRPEGMPGYLRLYDAFDPSGADTAEGLDYHFKVYASTAPDALLIWEATGEFGASQTEVIVIVPASVLDDGDATLKVSATIIDKDGGSTIDWQEQVIDNVAPSATFQSPQTVDEGSDALIELINVFDPSTADTATLRHSLSCSSSDPIAATWADATPGAPPYSKTCSYVDNDTYTVRGTVFDDDGGVASHASQIKVNNVAPSVDITTPMGGTFSTAAPVSASADFTDPGAADTHVCVIDWGDGTSTTIPLALGERSCSSSHLYAAPGTYMITVTISDDDQGVGWDTVTVGVAAVVLAIDADSIGKGAKPNSSIFTSTGVNESKARIGQRTPLPAFQSRVGSQLELWTGQVGDEGWFALETVPTSWNGAGPTAIGLRNYVLAGSGLGSGSSPEKWLDKVPNVTPLRATGLKLLVGQSVCAVVYKSDVSMNYGPLNGSLKGDNLGTVAFKVKSVTQLTGQSSSSLPKVIVEVQDATKVCGSPLVMFTAAPAPSSSSSPMDTRP